MRWFWIIGSAAAAAFIGGLIFGFFNNFEPTDWTTFGAAAIAFLLSLFTLSRSRAPGVHWSKPVMDDSNGGTPLSLRSHATATFIQEGPATAERVRWQVKPPGGEWGAIEDNHRGIAYTEVKRGKSIWVSLYDVQGTRKSVTFGTYQVRLHYRQLPNTEKERKTGAFKIEVKEPRAGQP